MDRKDVLIRQAETMIARHNQNLDYRTKVLYNQVRHAVSKMDEGQLALVLTHTLKQ